MIKDRSNSDHLGDGIYVHYTGYSYEISVNHHNNPSVAVFDEHSLDAFNNFAKRMKEEKQRQYGKGTLGDGKDDK